MNSYSPSFGVHTLFRITILFLVLVVANSLRPHHYISETSHAKGTNVGDESNSRTKKGAPEELAMDLYPTGSSLPDCARACGPCHPCKRVMVSFKCSTESCPVVYRCMCGGRYYHVPSN